MYFRYGTEETGYLKKKDPKLGEIIERIGHIDREIDPDLFSSVIHQIVGQQISTKAQETIWNRIQEQLGEVNANTVMRSYEYLQSQEVIYNKRGIGFFVASGAKALIHSLRKELFLKEEVDGFFRQLYTLGISIKEVEKMYYEFIQKQNQ